MKTISTLKQKVNLTNTKRLTINTLLKQNFSLKQTINGSFNTKNFFRIKPKKQEPKDHSKENSSEESSNQKTSDSQSEDNVRKSIFDELSEVDEAKSDEEKEILRQKMEINNKPVLDQMEYFNRNGDFDKTLDLYSTMLYRETLKDRKYLNIQYKIAKKKLEAEYKVIQRCLGVSNVFTFANMLVFVGAAIFFYVVSNFYKQKIIFQIICYFKF
jgi:hypothetical protein